MLDGRRLHKNSRSRNAESNEFSLTCQRAHDLCLARIGMMDDPAFTIKGAGFQ